MQLPINQNKDKIILDLCGGTGSWSKPYSDAGYDVRVITLPEFDVRMTEFNKNENEFRFDRGLGKYPIRVPREKVYGILAAPPCTMFSFARTNAKTLRDLEESMLCVRACMNIIWIAQEIRQDTSKKTLPLKFWALENPYYGFLKNFLGKPAFIFDPWEFGDGYQKKTALWGSFNEPIKNPVSMTDKMKSLAKTNSFLHTMKNSTNRGKPPSIWAKKDLKKFDMLASKDIHPESDLDRQDRRAITPAGFAKAFFDSNR